MACSELRLTVNVRRRVVYWPLYFAVGAGFRLGLIHDYDAAAEFLVKHGMKVVISGPTKGY